ncbi:MULTISPECIES: hypothetical protein [Bacillaceae]|uniref:IDEAL domain-containing protein n=1 Tax=Domibacillus aminovorans TaxID=29332 RepID=A0A177KX84_9BACI|nr:MULTISPECIES: hypothetical protein [Bacillaceae]OAH57756.1 hypothetical protein AWH48_01685 [Domibacillus aminovorans]
MNIGDWVLAASGRYWYMSYIDSFSKYLETVHVTKITRFIRGVPENIKPAPATCSMSLIVPLDSSLLKEDYDSLIDLAIITADKEWFFELRERMMADARA